MNKGKSKPNVSNRVFAEVPAPKYRRSLFKRQFGNKLTLNEGDIIPFHVDELYGGDTVNVDATVFLRLATPLHPIMDNIDVDIHAFFVPSRLVMHDYYKMFGMSDNPTDINSWQNIRVPRLKVGIDRQFGSGSLADYFGIPTKVNIPDDDAPIVLPFRAYNLIWNTYYRDQNLQNPVSVHTDNNDELSSDGEYNILRRNKKHDYFTSCLPFAQKGSAVNLPIGGSAPVTGSIDSKLSNSQIQYKTDDGMALTPYVIHATVDPDNDAHLGFRFGFPPVDAGLNSYVNRDVSTTHNLRADLSQATAVKINDLRDAITIQHILERRARTGTRDVEILNSMYGVSPSDSRLQRPELISASRSDLVQSVLPQSSSSTDTSPQGNLSSVGTMTAKIRFAYNALENGYLFIMVSTRGQVSYQNGMARMWSKSSCFDFMDPLRANLGEQPVLRKEIFMSSDSESNNKVFGYLPNYDDLRFGRNIITGYMRSNTGSESFDIWHIADNYSTSPTLNADWIKQRSSLNRCLAVDDSPQFFGDSYVRCNHVRVLPVHSIPGLSRI